MPGPSNRSVVITSGLLTPLVRGGATLAIAFRNGWVHVTSAAPGEVAVYRGKLEDTERAFTEHDDDRHEGRSRQRKSDDD